jgi:hypothetical protein
MDILSEHFSWAEASVTTHREIDNVIPSSIFGTIKNTARGMERVRAALGDRSVSISSWYRCSELNISVGSSTTSQHIKGEAVDFICPKFGTPLEIVRILSKYPELIRFDQLILEHTWIHISFNSDPNASQRHQVLTLLKNKKYASGITDLNGVPV